MLIQSRLDEDGAFFNGPLEAKHNNNNKPHLSLANLGGGGQRKLSKWMQGKLFFELFFEGGDKGVGGDGLSLSHLVLPISLEFKALEEDNALP